MLYKLSQHQKIDIKSLIEFLKDELKKQPNFLNYENLRNKKVKICLGFLRENPEIALVISEEGLYLKPKNFLATKVQEDEYCRYEDIILETIEIAKKEMLPLWTEYLEKSKYSKFFE